MDIRMPARRRTLVSFALITTFVFLPLMAPVAQAQGQQSASGLAVPIMGTATNVATGTVQNISGTFTIQRFASVRGESRGEPREIVAVGTYVTTVMDVTGVAQTVVTQLSIPLANTNSDVSGAAVAALASCDVLNLVLGPLDLNLLGLQVHLDQVVLDITAVTGPGNLLGNLVAALCGLLDGGIGGLVGQVVDLLNRLLAVLG